MCRTTTCDPAVSCGADPERCCQFDADGCDQNGKKIVWPSSCVSYSVGESGAPQLELTSDEFSEVLGASFGAWLDHNDCSGAPPSLVAEFYGATSCEQLEVNQGPKARNANIWFFPQPDAAAAIDSTEPSLDSSAIALATVTFDPATGEIWDIDVEIDANQISSSAEGSNGQADFQSILTHEVGHFLGLEHSRDPSAVMWPYYSAGDTSKRKITEDDTLGVCTIYPEDRDIPTDSCEPRGGYSSECGPASGCQVTLELRSQRLGPWLLLLLSYPLLVIRRRFSRG
ncbi:MAG: M10 family metallopeptidase domain-containing protein [Polyangiaceae bacterium]|nr:M10 family metallopeptidase domain-containing protein [Polyangiaceae bacterium]